MSHVPAEKFMVGETPSFQMRWHLVSGRVSPPEIQRIQTQNDAIFEAEDYTFYAWESAPNQPKQPLFATGIPGGG